MENYNTEQERKKQLLKVARQWPRKYGQGDKVLYVGGHLRFGRNITHASDSVENARKEIKLWFKPEELVSWQRAVDAVVLLSAVSAHHPVALAAIAREVPVDTVLSWAHYNLLEDEIEHALEGMRYAAREAAQTFEALRHPAVAQEYVEAHGIAL